MADRGKVNSRIDDSDDERGSLQLARLILAITDGRAIDSSTSLVTATGEDSDRNEAAAKADIQEDGDDCEDGNATEEAG